jgi:hypothetical protein
MMRGFFLMPTLLAACASLPPAGQPVTGEWGGTHIGLSLTPNGGTLDYDCAAGTISSPLLLNSDGTFSAEGMHTPGWGGPEIVGQTPPSYRVRYGGRVRGNTMTLQGWLENGVALGPFTLRLGAEPIIFRCL